MLILLWGFLQTEWGQNWLAGEITKRLSRDLQSKVTIQKVKVGLFSFDKMDLDGLLVEDQKKDTLLYAGKFQIKITDWFFFRDKPVLKYVGLQDAVININRSDSVWNYHFLESYFSSPGKEKKEESGVQFDLKHIVLNNVSFYKKDKWLGNDLIIKTGKLDLTADQITFSQKLVAISNVELTDPYFSIFDYKGNYKALFKNGSETVDTASSDIWKLTFKNVIVHNGRLHRDLGS